MTPCRGCGFWLSPEAEFCPGCGLNQEEESWWTKLSKGRGSTSKTCLRRQETRIKRELGLLDVELSRLEVQAKSVRSRIEKAESEGREPVVLRRSLTSLDAAIEHQKKLRQRYRTLDYGVQLDWLENDLVYHARPEGTLGDTADVSFDGHNRWATCVAVGPDSDLVASGGHDNTVRLWSIGRRRQIGTLKGFPSWVTSVGFRPDRAVLATACRGAGADLWDVTERARFDTVPSSPEVLELAMSPDGKWLAMSINRFYGSHALRIQELGGERATHTIEMSHFAGRAFAFDPRSRHLAFRDEDSTIGFFDLTRGEVVRHMDGSGTSMLAYSPDGCCLACGATLRDLETGEVVTSLWDGSAPSCLAFSPSGDWLAVGTASGTVTIRDGDRWSPVMKIFAHERTVQDLDFSPDGRWLVTVGDGGIRLWLLPSLLSESVRRSVRIVERLGADEPVRESAEGFRLFERAHHVLERAIRSRLKNLGHDMEGLLSGTETLDAQDVKGALDRLAERLEHIEIGASEHLESFRELVDELPIRAVGPAVEAFLEAVARRANGLREADEEECTKRLSALEDEERRGRALLEVVEELPEATRSRPAAATLGTALQRTLDQLPEIVDLIVARQTAAALGSLDPIAEQSPLNALNAQRDALNETITTLLPDRATESPPPALPGKVGVFDELDERAAVLEAIEEERHRFTSSEAAVKEVDQLLEDRSSAEAYPKRRRS